MQQATFSVVIPICNGMEHLEMVVQDCLQLLPRVCTDHEIILVDAGSDDQTFLIAEHLAVAAPTVMFIAHSNPIGVGQAVISGIRAARGDYVLLTDATNQINISEMLRLLPYIEHYPLVLGYRLNPQESWLLRRRQAFFRFLINRWCRLELRDTGCRFSLYHTEALQSMALQSTGPLILAEICLYGRQHGHPHVQVGVQSTAVRSRQQRRQQAWLNRWSLWQTMRLYLRLAGPGPVRKMAPVTHAPMARPRTVLVLLAAGVFVVARGAQRLMRRKNSVV
ncbi:MAG: glycosyltransferase family 2 protein [Chloroflexaceae bacterium]|nr:glycosyltransferase family 2 protein [Chloroflexaceae bacterium]